MRHRPGASVAPFLPLPAPSPAAFALVALLAPFAAPAQVVREKVAVEAVTVTLTARDGAGRPVRDLRATDLALSVDGKPVAIDTFTSEPRTAAASDIAMPATTLPRPPAGPIATPPSQPQPVETAIVVDEGSAYPFDRRDVYDQLSRFLSAAAHGPRLFLVARVTISGLVIECPWTGDAGAARTALARLRAHPSLLVHPMGAFEIEISRRRFFAAILELFAAFSGTTARREFLLVTDGILLARPEDLAGYVSNTQQISHDPSRPGWQPFGSPAGEQGRQAFQLWSRAVSSRLADTLTVTDLTAKALERDIVLIPIAAVAIDRGDDPGMEMKSLEPSTPDSGVLSGRVGLVQAMMRVAEDTGGEPVLLPKKTATRLAEIGGRESYELTFRDPSAGDHESHTIEIACRRPGVRLEYRRGYRIATEEDRTLDRVVARFRQPPREENPLSVKASLTPAVSEDGRNVTRVSLRYSPPRESAQSADRAVELLAVGEDAQGNRTEPIRWAGTASRLDAAGTFEAKLDLGVPAGSYTWSLGVRDQPTGLVSYILSPSRP